MTSACICPAPEDTVVLAPRDVWDLPGEMTFTYKWGLQLHLGQSSAKPWPQTVSFLIALWSSGCFIWRQALPFPMAGLVLYPF